MQVAIHQSNGLIAAEIQSDSVLIASAQDALDIMFDPALQQATILLLYRAAIAPEFFDLQTGLAGDVVQKFVNYRKRLVIIGDFSGEIRPSLRAFIVESNRGNHLYFAQSLEEAKKALF